jgi:hypothetical protein
MNELMYSCKKAVELISQSQDEPLGLVDRMRLKMHLSICGNCDTVNEQMSQMSAMMRAPVDDDGEGLKEK